MSFQFCRFLFAACAVSLFASQSWAAILYGDFSDVPPGAVMYTDVTESSSTDPVPPPRYGAPTITGNNLDFDPNTFGANATDGAPSADITDGQLNFGFMTLPGAGMTALFIDESGDLSLFGSGTAVTSVGAGLFAEVEITHVNGAQLAFPLTVVGSSQLSADLTSTPGLNQPWANGLLVDFGPALLNAGFNPAKDFATKGEVAINNTLVAISEANPNTIAAIIKKDFKIIPDIEIKVPEPTTIVVLFLGLAVTSMQRRRFLV